MRNTSLTEGRSLGVNFPPGQLPVIQVWAPRARSLVMEVEGKGRISLQEMPYGYWHATCPGLKPGDRYLLNVSGQNSYPDPASLSQPDGVHEASECADLHEVRKISDESWRGASIRDLIIYELHVGTFTPEGTFKSMREKLDYLEELGINAIEIMPVAAFPGMRNWGYDGVFPFAVQESYGGAIEFARLIKACHQKGIAVILDVVYNHLGPEGNYLNAYGPFLTGKYQTPWGKAINFDDAWCDGVRHYFLENALMWLRDFHVDGLRLDAVHAMKDMGPKHFLRELSEQVNTLNRHTGAKHFLIGECDLNDTRFISPPDQGGYGLDAQWCDEWHHALHALMTGERQGYYSDFGSLRHLISSFNHAYVYPGNYSPHRKRFFGTPTAGYPGQRFVVFTQNHDQVGNRTKGDRLSAMLDFESLKLAAGAMLASPFVPMLFMGEEYAEDSPFLYFVSHGDKKLLDRVSKGRKHEFPDLTKQGDSPEPASEESFERSRLRWDWPQNESKKQMLAFYQRLIALRKGQRLLKPGKRDNVLAFEAAGGKAIILSRKAGRESLIAVMNFAEERVTVEMPDMPAPGAELLVYSAHRQWGGNVGNNANPLIKKGQHLAVKTERRSFIIFRATSAV